MDSWYFWGSGKLKHKSALRPMCFNRAKAFLLVRAFSALQRRVCLGVLTQLWPLKSPSSRAKADCFEVLFKAVTNSSSQKSTRLGTRLFVNKNFKDFINNVYICFKIVISHSIFYLGHLLNVFAFQLIHVIGKYKSVTYCPLHWTTWTLHWTTWTLCPLYRTTWTLACSFGNTGLAY